MSERLEVSPENHSRQATVRRLLGRAGVCLAGGALMAAPYAAVSSLSHAEVRDDLGPVPASVKLAPGHSAIDLGVLGSVYDESLTGAGIGLNIEVDGPPSILESIDTNNPDRLVKPFGALYQDPTGAIEGYRVAMEREIKRELLTTELRTTAALSTLAFIIASLGSNVPSRERKRYLAATFGGISMLSVLASADMFHQWQEEHAYPAVTYPITAISSPEPGTVTASNRLLASIIDRAAPLIEEQRERND